MAELIVDIVSAVRTLARVDEVLIYHLAAHKQSVQCLSRFISNLMKNESD